MEREVSLIESSIKSRRTRDEREGESKRGKGRELRDGRVRANRIGFFIKPYHEIYVLNHLLFLYAIKFLFLPIIKK